MTAAHTHTPFVGQCHPPPPGTSAGFESSLVTNHKVNVITDLFFGEMERAEPFPKQRLIAKAVHLLISGTHINNIFVIFKTMEYEAETFIR